jgi:uncharacterized protein (DUF58 family)
MVFTRRFWWLLAAGMVLAVLGAYGPAFLLLLVAYDLFLFGLALAGLLFVPQRDQFVVSRIHDPVLSVRADNLVRVLLTNRSRSWVKVTLRDEPPPEFQSDEHTFELTVAPGQTVESRYHVRPENRGEFEFRGQFLRAPTSLGLAHRIYRLPEVTRVSVYPNILALRKYDLLKHRGHLREMGIRRASLKGVGGEFESLREYIPGDETRKVDWKASARRAKLIVRQYEAERSQSVILALDLGRLMMAEVEGVRKYDHVIDAALMLANAAVHSNDRVGLLVYHDLVVRFIPPKRGRAQIGIVLEALHGLEPQSVESDPVRALNYLARRWRKRSLVVAFTDLIEPESSRQIVSALSTTGRTHLCVAVTVNDPFVEALATQRTQTPRALYQRAVALQVQDERAQAIRQLSLAGVQVVDAEPGHLAQALVNFYTRAKARGEL